MISTVHASAVALGEAGVLIRGASGAGKSAFAVALTALWQREGDFAALVADDRTALAAVNGALIARAPPALTGRIEVRGVGIVPVPALPAVRLSLVVDLEEAPERMPDPAHAIVCLHGIALRRLAFPKRAAQHNAETLRYVLTSDALTHVNPGAQPVPRDYRMIEGKRR